MVAGVVQVACPNCGSAVSTPWARESGFTMVRCSACRLLYVNPRPADETISEANRVGVHKTDEGNLNIRTHWRASKVAFYRRTISRMIASGPKTWLDVGAGHGEVVMAATEAIPGLKALGIEPMEPKVAEAKRRGLPVEPRRLEDVDQQFDVVSLINVFSHIPEFTGDFGKLLAAKVKPGGFLLMETGNIADLEDRGEFHDMLHLPDHLVFGGVTQITAMLSRLGFKVVVVMKRRTDGPTECLKQFVKGLLRGTLSIYIPYSSDYRSLVFKCQKVA